MVVVVAGCGSSSSSTSTKKEEKKPKIVVASKPFAEQYVLGHMIAELLKAKADVDVDTSKIGMGQTEMLQPAMEKGEIDIYPEYTGTAWMVVLKQPIEHDKNVIYSKTKEMYAQKWDIQWLPPLGFNDTFALAITSEFAKDKNIKTIDDLGKLDGLTLLGDPNAFTREDEYPGLEKVYGLKGTPKVVDVNFYYEALKQKQADVALVFSTDGRLKQYNLVVADDSKNFFPPYQCAIVARGEVLKNNPKIQEVLSPLFGKIDEKTMIDLNYQVEVEKKDPAEVAKEFLKSKGLL
jgi:glycine betaine/choline ABC-type transport system substrate-binding protein